MSAAIRLVNITKLWGDTRALDGIDLVIEPGSFCVLLGPSRAWPPPSPPVSSARRP